jgi:hypothetical protein
MPTDVEVFLRHRFAHCLPVMHVITRLQSLRALAVQPGAQKGAVRQCASVGHLYSATF